MKSRFGIGAGPAKGPGNQSPVQKLDTSVEKQRARGAIGNERQKFYRENPDHPDTCLFRLRKEREKLRKLRASVS